jgi:hypothetical protein
VDKPFREAPVSILFDYGIDNIRENLKFLKKYTGASTYKIGDIKLHNSLDAACKLVESKNLEKKLENTVISLWESIEIQFNTNRKKKKR